MTLSIPLDFLRFGHIPRLHYKTNLWFAPNSTDNDFTQYSLTLTIKDRDCQAINSVTERRACQEEDVKEHFLLVNVTQRPKSYTSDTTISLQESSSISQLGSRS